MVSGVAAVILCEPICEATTLKDCLFALDTPSKLILLRIG